MRTTNTLYELTIEELFPDDSQLAKVVREHFTSPVPLLLIPRWSLMNLKGIGPKRSQQIVQRLAENRLEMARSNETLDQTIRRLFGSLEQAPAQALSVVWRQPSPEKPSVWQVQYEPLQALELIGKITRTVTVERIASAHPVWLAEDLWDEDCGYTQMEVLELVEELKGRLAEYGLSMGLRKQPPWPEGVLVISMSPDL